MTPFCKVDSTTYIIRVMVSFLKLYFFFYFFVILFQKMKKIIFTIFFYILSP
ncbi:unnamed protein product, partial [Staurois parvus]